MTTSRLIALACLALGVALAAPARAEIKTQWIDYKQGDTQLRGYLAYDDAIKDERPGVLLVHRRDGMSALTLKNAEMVARLREQYIQQTDQVMAQKWTSTSLLS